jgi:hypothetical protein
MDETELEILRRFLPGDQQFNLYTESEKEANDFNEWGDKMLDLRDRALLEFPDGLIQRNHRGGPARYYRIGVRRVTAEGRRELRRHEPPDDAVVQVIRAKVDHDVAGRRRILGAKYGELRSQAGLHSSRMMLAVEQLVEDEYLERGKIVISAWRAVMAAQGLTLTTRVAQMIKDDLGLVLDGQSPDVKEVFLGSPTTREGKRTKHDLYRILDAVRHRTETEIDFAVLTPIQPAVGPAQGGITHQTVFNLSGSNSRVNIGSDDSSSNVVNITPAELFRELRTAFETQVEDAEERGRVLARLEVLEQAQQTPSFGQRYVEFMAAAASHATVIGPYLPALAQLLQR